MSGGSLKSLFEIIKESGLFAIINNDEIIQIEHARQAVNKIRYEFSRHFFKKYQSYLSEFKNSFPTIDDRFINLIRYSIIFEYQDEHGHWYDIPACYKLDSQKFLKN